MPYFDNNVVYSADSPYYPYVSESAVYRDNSYNYCNQWNVSNERFTHRRPPQISKLRTILSETITNITKDNQLQKGESVELTLEIEMMRTENNSPTNSLVEVTIIQHNKSKEQTASDCGSFQILTNKMPFQVETISSKSESPSEKRKNWFQRVITKPHNITSKRILMDQKKMQKYPIVCSNKNVRHNQAKNCKNPRSNFLTILPEEDSKVDYKKGYRRVSPPKLKPPIPNLTKTASRKTSLIKKLSNIFLPTKNADKRQAVETALSALKNEVDNMKLVTQNYGINKSGIKKKRIPVHNLGKLVSNILVDMMEKSDNAATNQVKSDAFPVQCQSFFEPIPKSNNKKQKENMNNRKAQPFVKLITESHSDTCCLKPLYTTSEPSLQTSISLIDCRSLMDKKIPEETQNIGDSTNISPQKRSETEMNYLRDQKKRNANGDAKNSPNKNAEGFFANNKQNKSIHSKRSVVNWGGHILHLNRKKKSRIEHLIVKELQNLALKEGMECEVTPLPTVDANKKNTSTIEKVSSFICELDVSDKKFEKEIGKRKSIEKKVKQPLTRRMKKTNQHFSTHNKNKITNPLLVNPTNMKMEKRIPEIANDERVKDDSLRINFNVSQSISNSSTYVIPLRNKTAKNKSKSSYFNNREEVKITYLNKNMKNWSAESNTVVFESPNLKYSENTNIMRTEANTYICDNRNSRPTAVSSGFVKVIKPDDRTWNRYVCEQDERENGNSTQMMTVTSTETAVKFHSATSNEFDIELEVDIKDLESILKEAKHKKVSDRYVLNAKYRGDKKPKAVKITGKNSPAYTNQLLSNAAKKLEKYVKIKPRHK